MPELFKECGVWNPAITNHNMVYGLMMEKVGYHKSKLLSFRNRKNINEKELLKDLHMAPWHVGSIFDSTDDQYSLLELYSTASDPQPQMIPRPQMIPKIDRK